jgi:hypothetical protein
MTIAIFYLAQRFIYRIFEFLRHWYVKSVRIYLNYVINLLEKIDYYFAWEITLKNLFRPLYKDYSVIGYALGFFFRIFRLLVSSLIYLLIFGVIIAIYLAWVVFPILLVGLALFKSK